MNTAQVKKLHPGDQVKWNDPDGGACSKIVTIAEIEITGDIVCITGRDGSYLECYAHELT